MPNVFDYENQGQGTGFTFTDMYKSIIQGTWTYFIDIQCAYNFTFHNSSDTQNDEIEYELCAEKGVKTFEVMGVKGPMYCEASIYLDDVYQGKIDLYKVAPYAKNERLTIPVTVLSTGKHSVKLKCATRNPLATNWAIALAWLRIY